MFFLCPASVQNTLLCLCSNRAEESEEMAYMKELTSLSEPTQIQLGLL